MSSFIASFIWASVTAGLLALASGNPLASLILPLLMCGEASGWSQWWPNRPDGGDKVALNKRGLQLLNPFMGYIYFYTYAKRDALPKTFLASGWTEWAELACGFVTATAYALILIILSMV